jgi:hypothetical protein
VRASPCAESKRTDHDVSPAAANPGRRHCVLSEASRAESFAAKIFSSFPFSSEASVANRNFGFFVLFVSFVAYWSARIRVIRGFVFV